MDRHGRISQPSHRTPYSDPTSLTPRSRFAFVALPPHSFEVGRLERALASMEAGSGRDEVALALRERQAYVETAVLLSKLERALSTEAQAASRRRRKSQDCATAAGQLAERINVAAAVSGGANRLDGDPSALRVLSRKARDVIPMVDAVAKSNELARTKSAKVVGDLRSQIAASARLCQPLCTHSDTALVVSLLVDVAKVKSLEGQASAAMQGQPS